jgi:hypothetical protein
MSVKINQAFTLELDITTTAVITNATSSYMSYINPSGTTGIWSTTILTATTSPNITYFFSTGIINVLGDWRITSWIKSSDGNTYPAGTYILVCVNEFSTN